LSNSLAPFVPSHPDVVKRMLEMANVGSSDTVYDIGCGDGRILIAAVKDFGAKKAVGYEMREDLYKQALQEVKKQGLEDRISIINSDVFNGQISEATVVTLYLTTSGNDKLRHKLAAETTKGTRIISHDFKIPHWHLAKSENNGGHMLYLYTIPDALAIRDERPFFRRLF
jgi:tRNA A58 N-methylase Trm61